MLVELQSELMCHYLFGQSFIYPKVKPIDRTGNREMIKEMEKLHNLVFPLEQQFYADIFGDISYQQAYTRLLDRYNEIAKQKTKYWQFDLHYIPNTYGHIGRNMA